ncbi:carbohydrate ABC transporter permease [Stackebrandtia soli]|uniref:carbohydrate ABC transporter permease n=1 Tax=Stackebrandtia soli TaxID=1892856 RepID=UPI0039EBCECE
MTFDFVDELPKLGVLGVGLIAFVLVVLGLLALANLAPNRERGGATASVFLIPALILLGIGLIVPAVRTTILSFFDKTTEVFVGLDNYIWVFTDPEILLVVRNTVVWVVLTPLLATAIGLVYAVLIDKTRFEALAKTLVFLPMAISFVGASIIWRFVYDYKEVGDQIGLLNQIMVWLGFTPQPWLTETPWNNVFLIVVMVWIQAGFATVVLSAAIKGIPAEIIEAARLDGVNAWQMFWRITVPSIRAAVIVVIVTMSIAALKLFDIVRTMTGGQNETSVLANEMYFQAFVGDQDGRGAALAVVLFLLVVPIIAYQVHNIRKRREIA